MLRFASSTVYNTRQRVAKLCHLSSFSLTVPNNNSGQTICTSALNFWPLVLALMTSRRIHSRQKETGFSHLNMAFGLLGFRLTDQELSQCMSKQRVRKLTRNLLQCWTIA